jgi:predicted permease
MADNITGWWSRLRTVWRRRALDADLRDEIAAHLQLEVDALIERGLSPAAARSAARQRFGSRHAVREAARDAWRLGSLETLVHDLRHAARLLRRAPGFSTAAVAIVALGIGATAATFTLLDHVLLRPLPFAQPDRLMLLYETRLSQGVARTPTSLPNFLDWKAAARSFDAMGAYIGILFPINFSGHGEPRRLESAQVTAEVFEVLGVAPVAGRLLTPGDDRLGAPDVVLVSDRLAGVVFGGASAAVGQTLSLDNQPTTVVGVMPRTFAFPAREADVWRPLKITEPMRAARSNHFLYAVGRVRRGVSIAQARADMAVIADQLQRGYPKENTGTAIAVVDLRDLLSPQSRGLVVAIFVSAVCLLLIACTNLANLLVARAVVRRQELAIRMALGAGRTRVIRQLLTEHALLVAVGGLLGLAAASTGVPLLARLVPATLPVGTPLAVDWRAVAFAAGLVLLTTLTFGLGPAMRSWRTADLRMLRTRATPGAGRWGRSALVLAEVTGSVVLLVGAGLLVKSLWRVQAIDPGFRAEGVLNLRTALPMPKYAKPDARQVFYQRVLDGARALPGVTAVAYTSYQPMEFASGRMPVTSPGFADDPLTAPEAVINFITPGFFDTLGVPLRSGRDVNDRDDAQAAFVAIVSDRLAQRLWPGRDPIGQRLFAARAERTVVGVAADIAVRRLEGASDLQIYFPAQQLGPLSAFYAPKDLLVRASGDLNALAPSLQRLVHAVDPHQAVTEVRPLADIVAAQTAPRRDQAMILAVFAVLAFVLAMVGLHGVLSYAVASRTQEIGVRVALGAERSAILALFLRQGLALGVLGVAVALPLAYATAQTMRALLFGVQPGDPMIYGVSVSIALGMTVISSAQPALRASRIDPAATIRNDS